MTATTAPAPSAASTADDFVATCAAVAPHVDEAICALGPTLRDVIVQHYLQGQDADQIARAQRLPLREVFSLIDLALHALQTRLEDIGVACCREHLQAVLRGDAQRPSRGLARRVVRQIHPGAMQRLRERIERVWDDLVG